MTEKSFSVRYENETSELVMDSDFISIVSKSNSSKNKIRVRYDNVRKHFLNRKRMAVKIDLIRGSSVIFHLLGEDKGASLARINDEMVRRLKEVSSGDDVVVRKKRKRRKGEERMLSAIRDEEKEEVRERVRRAPETVSRNSKYTKVLQSRRREKRERQDLYLMPSVTQI